MKPGDHKSVQARTNDDGVVLVLFRHGYLPMNRPLWQRGEL